MIRFSYENYQNVRHNLFLYSIPVFIIAGFFCYFLILPKSCQDYIDFALAYCSNNKFWKAMLGSGTGVAILTIVAFLMIEILKIHDQWYDKFIIRWRFYYAIDFILPRLISPFAPALNYRFYEEAKKNIGEFQERLYYPFVGDRDLKIEKNKLVRFYEVVTIYWLTQINEIVILFLGFLIGVLRFLGPADQEYHSTLLTSLIIIAACFLFNRAAIRNSLLKVRKATFEEIRAIHDNAELLKDLKRRLENLCTDYKIPYNEPTYNKNSI